MFACQKKKSTSTSDLPSWWKRLPIEQKQEWLERKEREIYGSKPPNQPHPRQLDFLKLTCEEALYGGAGGAGKTWTLLTWLGEGAGLEGYTGIFFRRTYPQLTTGNDSPWALSYSLYQPFGGIPNESSHTWKFPSGAQIVFRHLQHENSVYNYQGPSFHRVAYDELCQYSEDQYTYLFSRMRKHVGYPIPCGMRAATNPGGRGAAWVRKRFVTQEAINFIASLGLKEPTPANTVFWPCPDTAFVPARVCDNPTIDVDDYLSRLKRRCGPVLAAQIAAGDWSVSEGTQIDPGWMHYYETQGNILRYGNNGSTVVDDDRVCQRFAVIDTAGTSKEKAAEDRGRPPSWSVCGVYDHSRKSKTLYRRHVGRWQVGYPDLKLRVKQTLLTWKPPKVYVENAHFGPALVADLQTDRELHFVKFELLPTKLPGMRADGEGAKLERATAAGLFDELEHGRLRSPCGPDTPMWVSEHEAELSAWTGRSEETADQIDVDSYACYVTRRQSATWSGKGVVAGGGFRR
jgi:hypothetical protein